MLTTIALRFMRTFGAGYCRVMGSRYNIIIGAAVSNGRILQLPDAVFHAR